jgi:uncharacterized membrane protein
MTINKLYKIITVLSFIGILLSMYLLWQQMFTPAFKPCSINSYINCDAVITGEVSKTLGIPTPLYGLIGYIVIFWSSIFKKKKVMFATALFGVLFCLYLAFVELFILYVICPVCITCQIVMISIAISSWLINKRKE